MNPRPPGPQPGALTKLSYSHHVGRHARRAPSALCYPRLRPGHPRVASAAPRFLCSRATPRVARCSALSTRCAGWRALGARQGAGCRDLRSFGGSRRCRRWSVKRSTTFGSPPSALAPHLPEELKTRFLAGWARKARLSPYVQQKIPKNMERGNLCPVDRTRRLGWCGGLRPVQ